MNIAVNKIYSLRLNNGQEIIGKITEINDGSYQLESPLAIMMGQEGIQLAPALFTTDQNANAILYSNAIAYVSESREDVIDVYREATTGIKVPDKKIILG